MESEIETLKELRQRLQAIETAVIAIRRTLNCSLDEAFHLVINLCQKG